MENNNFWIIAIAVVAVVAIVAVFGMVSMTGYAMAKIDVEKGIGSNLNACISFANEEYEKCMEQTMGYDESVLPILVEECGTNLQKAIFACNAQYVNNYQAQQGGSCNMYTTCSTCNNNGYCWNNGVCGQETPQSSCELCVIDQILR